MFNKFYKLLVVLIALTSFSMGNAQAAECKSQSSSSCKSSDSCTWVSGYTKKDGNKVKGYCRTKGKSADSNKKSKDKKSKDKKSKDKKSKDKKSKDKKSKDKKSKDKKSKKKDKKSKDKKSKTN